MPTPTPDTQTPSEPTPQKECRIICPICQGHGIERKQKWHCAKCGQLLQTCCD